MITPESFKTRFPEFSCSVDRQLQMFIDDAVLILNGAYWGKKYDMGLSYLTAHFLTLAQRTTTGNVEANNAIASQAVDGTSVSFAAHTPDDQTQAYYASTSYGQRYLSIRSTLGVAACVI